MLYGSESASLHVFIIIKCVYNIACSGQSSKLFIKRSKVNYTFLLDGIEDLTLASCHA